MDDFDSYKLRVGGFWFYSHPMGHFSSRGNTGFLDLQAEPVKDDGKALLSNVADLLGFSPETRSRRNQRLAVIVQVNVAGRRLA